MIEHRTKSLPKQVRKLQQEADAYMAQFDAKEKEEEKRKAAAVGQVSVVAWW